MPDMSIPTTGSSLTIQAYCLEAGATHIARSKFLFRAVIHHYVDLTRHMVLDIRSLADPEAHTQEPEKRNILTINKARG